MLFKVKINAKMIVSKKIMPYEIFFLNYTYYVYSMKKANLK